MKKIHPIVALPTTSSPISKRLEKDYVCVHNKVHINEKAYHLYALSDEIIKKDDWFYSIYGIEQSDHDFKRSERDFKKIIATTDKSLRYRISTSVQDMQSLSIIERSLPGFSSDFLKEYCKRGGVDKININYLYIEGWNSKEAPIAEYVLDVDPDNIINVSFIEEKLYTREEVVEIINCFDSDVRGYHGDWKKEAWIKENL